MFNSTSYFVLRFDLRSVFGELQLTQTSYCNLKITGLWGKVCVAFLLFNFDRNYDVFKSKSSCIVLSKNITLIKMKRNRRRKIPHPVIERQALCFNSYKNCKLKVKLRCVAARKKKKRALFCTVYFIRRKLF